MALGPASSEGEHSLCNIFSPTECGSIQLKARNFFVRNLFGHPTSSTNARHQASKKLAIPNLENQKDSKRLLQQLCLSERVYSLNK